jgi:hypothetical protein
LQLVRKYRIPALFCTFAVLLCELISRPHVNMGVCDDWPYILMAQHLAATGHVAYNGWAAPMLGWQLYLGAAFIKLFGFSFTSVRMSTLLVSLVLAFVIQRTLVRANISERNATIGTLAFVLSPLYLMQSVIFMTDIFGLFAIVLCLYGCLRALQATTSRAAIAWICFAVATNTLCGTSRQIAWLGVLMMVPSTLWLLRAQRRVLITGAFATLAGALFIFGCIQWLKHQPYSIPEHVLPDTFPVAPTFWTLAHFFLELPLLLLPILLLFVPRIRKSGPLVIAIVCALILGYLFLHTYPSHLRGEFPLEPTVDDWVSTRGAYLFVAIQGAPPIFLNVWVQVILTIATLGGALGLIDSLRHSGPTTVVESSSPSISWTQLGVILAPFTIAYSLLLIPRATALVLSDRYLLGLLVIALLCLVRYYQDHIQPRLPFGSILMVAIMAIYGVTFTHNLFALYRARVALAAEIRTDGVPDTSVDNGWEYNLGVELRYANHINFPTIVIPPDAYVPTPPLPAGTCATNLFDYTPHVRPLYGISYDPNECYGPAPFAPVTYSRWLVSGPGTLYVVNYVAQPKR